MDEYLYIGERSIRKVPFDGQYKSQIHITVMEQKEVPRVYSSGLMMDEILLVF